MLRKARREDLPEIERVMRASMADLGARFYDADQVASAVQYIAVADGQLVDDGTYFVVEESSSEFLGVPRSSSEELARGSAPPRNSEEPEELRGTRRILACGGWSKRKKLFTGTSEQAQTEGFLDPAVDAAKIRAMFVDPAHARRGLGRQILYAAEEDARLAGFRTFELMATLPGVPLYRSCGYEEIERVEIELPDGRRLGCIRMRRCVK